MHSDIEKLMSHYSSDETTLIATADCQKKTGKKGTGDALCKKENTKYFPHIMYGKPGALKNYNGPRDFATMKAFVEKSKGGASVPVPDNGLPQPVCPVEEHGHGCIIEKILCAVATFKEVEDKAAAAICTKIVKQVPQIPASRCEIIVENMWERVTSKCNTESVVV